MANNQDRFEGFKNPKDNLIAGALPVLDFSGEAFKNLLFFKHFWKSVGFYFTAYTVVNAVQNILIPGAIGIIVGLGGHQVSPNANFSAQLSNGLTKTIVRPVGFAIGNSVVKAVDATAYMGNQAYQPVPTSNRTIPNQYGYPTTNVGYDQAAFITRQAFSDDKPQQRR
jgi:hypothetical protein